MSAGPQGVQGIQGVKGDQGLQGPTGLQGIQGPAGSGGGGASLTSTSNIVITAPTGVGINTTPAYTLDLNGGSLGNVGTLNVSKASSAGPVVVSNATQGTDYTITTSGSKTYYNFLATGKTMSITTATPLAVDYLTLGGGGAGGTNGGGGGGAGGLLQATGYSLNAGTYSVIIGDGGTANGGTGSNTSFGTIAVAVGGGGGSTGNTVNAGGIGGCGGGGGAPGSGSNTTNAGGGATQGFGGGSSLTNSSVGNFYNGGGGGGVASVGSNATSAGAGNGGTGITYNNGTALQLGGGGGAGGNIAGIGSFGGGGGGTSTSGGVTSGTANRGGGGGGGGFSGNGGSGGSGIFILAFTTTAIAPGGPATFGSASIDASFNLLVSATSNIRLAATNVGINVAQPTVALDVAGQIRGRVVLSNWTGTSNVIDFTQSTGNSIYNYITNTGFNALALSNPGSGYVGSYSVIKNNTTTGLSIALTYPGGATGPVSPLLLYSSNAATLIWSGPTGGYIQF